MRGAVVCLTLAAVPAVAQAPDAVLIRPAASCDAGKCLMSEADYRKLQQFHAERLAALMMAGDMIDALQTQNADLMRALSRHAAGRCGRLS